MAIITPAGAPLWARTITADDYGANGGDKANYLDRRGIDALTDVNADQVARLTADAVAGVRTAPFCVMTIQCHDTDAAPVRGDPDYAERLVHYHRPLVTLAFAAGSRRAPYWEAAPGCPTVARAGNGSVSITFDAAYTDSYGVSQSFAITQMTPGKVISSDAKACVCTAIDPGRLIVTLSAKTSAGTAIQDALITGVTFW